MSRSIKKKKKKHENKIKRIHRGLNEIIPETTVSMNNVIILKIKLRKALYKTRIQLLFKEIEDTSSDVQSVYECVQSNINSINEVCNVLEVLPVTIHNFPKKKNVVNVRWKKKGKC